MKKKELITLMFFILTLSILFSCNDNKKFVKTIELEHLYDIKLPITSNFFNQPWYSKLVKQDSTLYLFYYSNKSLFTYDIEKRKLLAKIDIPLCSYIEVNNKDSIFIILIHKNVSQDSFFFMCNYKGEIQKYFKINEIFKNNENKKKYSSLNSDYIYITNLDYFDEKIYLMFDKSTKYKLINDSNYNKFKIPILGYYNIKSDKIELFEQDELPFINENVKINRNYSRLYSCLYNENILLGFMYSDKVLKFNKINKIDDTLQFSSYFIDNFYIDNDDVYKVSNAYLDFTKIKNQNLLLRNCKIEKDIDLFTQILIDSNYVKIGEYISDSIFITDNFFDNKLYSYNLEKTLLLDDTIVFSVYYFKIININKDSLFNKYKKIVDKQNNSQCLYYKENKNIKTEKLEIYLKKKIKNDSYYLIYIPALSSCPPCVKETINFYNVNYKLFSQNNIFLLIVDNNTKSLVEFLKINSLPQNNDNIYIDSLNKFQDLLKEPHLQHLFIMKDKKIIFSKGYMPNELDSLYKKVLTKFSF